MELVEILTIVGSALAGGIVTFVLAVFKYHKETQLDRKLKSIEEMVIAIEELDKSIDGTTKLSLAYDKFNDLSRAHSRSMLYTSRKSYDTLNSKILECLKNVASFAGGNMGTRTLGEYGITNPEDVSYPDISNIIKYESTTNPAFAKYNERKGKIFDPILMHVEEIFATLKKETKSVYDFGVLKRILCGETNVKEVCKTI